MQISAIETFLAIDQTGSFHAAARLLNVTQTTVSARIKVLEDSLGAALFDRGPAGAQLTAAGRHFRPYAQQMLQTWEFVRADLPGRLQERISLRLGAQLSLWDELLADVAVWLEQELGKVPFTLNFDHALNMGEAVAQQLLDLAIVSEAPPGTRLQVAELPPEELVLVSDQGLELGQLGQGEQPLFINLGLGTAYDLQLQQALPGQRRQHIILGNARMGLRYLKQRGGMGYFPRAMVAADLEAGRVHAVAGAPALRLSCKALYHPDSPAAGPVEAVLRGLRELRGG